MLAPSNMPDLAMVDGTHNAALGHCRLKISPEVQPRCGQVLEGAVRFLVDSAQEGRSK